MNAEEALEELEAWAKRQMSIFRLQQTSKDHMVSEMGRIGKEDYKLFIKKIQELKNKS